VTRPQLVGNFYSRDFDDNYRFIADEDEEGIDSSIVADWFKEVPVEPVADVV
jgi:hypothetical protein